MASYVANHIRVICPSGLLRSTNSFLMNLSYNSERKVTKRTPPQSACPCGSPHHSPLPTGRPDSPSRLDMTKSDVPVGFALPKSSGSASFVGRIPLPSSSPKTASLIGSIDHGRSIESCRARTASQDDPLDRSPDVTKCNPGLFNAAGNSRITLRFIQATGMRSTSARDAFSFGYFALGMQRQIHQE